jgi:hypothetical protein
MTEMRTDSGTEWSWANVVLMKSPRSSSQPKPRINLSTCPDRSTSGQVDRSLPKFKSSRATAPEDISADADLRRAAAAPAGSNKEEGCAAILQQQVATRREWAESCARLNPDRSPADVPLKRWHQLIKDIGEFVDGGWAKTAAALGWTFDDLVGADPERPFARLDKAGLLWLSNGKRLVAMCENTATMETKTGVTQTYRRKPHEAGRVLVWELVPKI